MKRSLKLLTIILAFMMLLPLEAFAALDKDLKSAEADSFKIAKQEGEVTIFNASGKEIKLRDGADLKNGYKITTKEGYAYLNLDSEKLIKLDWNTTASLRKKEKKTEVLLEEGALFFSVNKPLEKDESLDIRTSTISTGIRGTIGVISVDSYVEGEGGYARLTRGGLLEGKADLAFYDRAKDIINVLTISAGDFFKSLSKPDLLNGVPYVQKLEMDVLPSSGRELIETFPFIIPEIAKDPALKERIIEAPNGIDEDTMEDIIKNGPELLKKKQEEDSKKREKEEKRVLDAITDLRDDEDKPNIIPVFEKKKPLPPAPPAVVTPEAKEEPPAPKKEEKPPREEEEEEDSGSGSGGSKPAPPPASVYKVTFMNGSAAFAVSEVKANEKAPCPRLMPTPSGTWYLDNSPYDFNAPVTANITLKWQGK